MVKRLAFVVLLTGCNTGFPRETLVEGLRVLGMSSSPADLRPGETAQLGALVLDPSIAPKKPSMLWVACEPDPFNLNRGACSDPAVLQDPAALASPDGGLPPGVKIIGFNDQARLTIDSRLFDALPADDERRLIGTTAQVLGIAVSDEVSVAASEAELRALFERVRAAEVDSLISLFRIRVSEDPQRNLNPDFGKGVSVDGRTFPPGATLPIRAGATLDVVAPAEAFETYEAYSPIGTETKTERLLVSWYSTAGALSETSTALGEAVLTVMTFEDDVPVPANRRGSLYVTLRDTRGGQAFRTMPFFVCDASLGAPQVISASYSGSTVVLTGERLGSILEVFVDGARAAGNYDPPTGRYEAVAVGVSRGVHALQVTSRTCSDTQALSLVVP